MAADAPGAIGDLTVQLRNVLGHEVGQLPPFPVGPDSLELVEFRGVGRQPFYPQPLALARIIHEAQERESGETEK